jgi:hypothetical protein
MRKFVCTAIGLSLIVLWGCRSQVEGLVGEYEAEGQAGTRLSLHADGGGLLIRGEQDVRMREAPFHWEVKEGRSIVVYPRNGPSTVLTLSPAGLAGDLPGMGKVVFRKK